MFFAFLLLLQYGIENANDTHLVVFRTAVTLQVLENTSGLTSYWVRYEARNRAGAIDNQYTYRDLYVEYPSTLRFVNSHGSDVQRWQDDYWYNVSVIHDGQIHSFNMFNRLLNRKTLKGELTWSMNREFFHFASGWWPTSAYRSPRWGRVNSSLMSLVLDWNYRFEVDRGGKPVFHWKNFDRVVLAPRFGFAIVKRELFDGGDSPVQIITGDNFKQLDDDIWVGQVYSNAILANDEFVHVDSKVVGAEINKSTVEVVRVLDRIKSSGTVEVGPDGVLGKEYGDGRKHLRRITNWMKANIKTTRRETFRLQHWISFCIAGFLAGLAIYLSGTGVCRMAGRFSDRGKQ